MQPTSDPTLSNVGINRLSTARPTFSPSSTDVKVQQLVTIPTLDLNSDSSSNDIVMMSPRPWNTPRGSYMETKVDFGLRELNQLVKSSKENWILINYSFTDESGEALKNYLKSPACHIRSLKFINCFWDLNFSQKFCEGLRKNKSVTFLHIEGSVLSKKIGACFREALAKGCYTLRTVNFSNSTIPSDAFHEIVKGITAQNGHVERIIEEAMKEKGAKASFFNRVCQELGVNADAMTISLNDLIRNLLLENDNQQINKITLFKLMIEEMVGVSKLCFEGCRFDGKHAPALKKLIEESQRLRELNLQGNRLGSLKGSMQSKTTVALALKKNVPQLASNSIILLTEALKYNSKLSNLILSSNLISSSDWEVLNNLLIDTKDKKAENTTVTVNLTNNQLEKLPDHNRLIVQGSSPRSVSCHSDLVNSPRVIVDTRPHRSSLRIVSDPNSETEVDKVKRVRSETVI